MQWDKRASDSLKALNKRVLPVLCRRFYNKGLMPIEIKRLTRDILNIIGNGGFYNADILNKKLERLGWRKNIVDNYIFELILYYFEYEGTYKPDIARVQSVYLQNIQGHSRSKLLQDFDNEADGRLGLDRRVKIIEDMNMKKIISEWMILLFSITCIVISIAFSILNIVAK